MDAWKLTTWKALSILIFATSVCSSPVGSNGAHKIAARQDEPDCTTFVTTVEWATTTSCSTWLVPVVSTVTASFTWTTEYTTDYISYTESSSESPSYYSSSYQTITESSSLSTTASASATTTTSTSTSVSATDTLTSAVTNPTLAVTTVSDEDSSASAETSYTFYSGDGSSSAGWPQISSWVSFDTMWTALLPVINSNCISPIPQNSDQESADIRSAIEAVAAVSYFDHRVILAIVMQETHGCVRAATTNGSVPNPGLMQSYNGSSCADFGSDQCPTQTIFDMIADGTQGTIYGQDTGLVQHLDGDAKGPEAAQSFYQAARFYNTGLIDPSGDLGVAKYGVSCYCSDVANWLTGWTGSGTTCTLANPSS